MSIHLLRTAAAGVVVGLLVGCGPTITHTPPGERVDGNLALGARQDPSGPTYFEGALRYVKVDPITGPTRVLEMPEDQDVTITVPSGEITITAWERVCSGNCGDLGPVTNQCSVVLDIPVGGTGRVDITWTVPNPCVMETAIGIS